MHDSRKTFLNVLIDNIINPLNLVIVIIAIILILNQQYLYLIPLALSLLASLFQFGVDFKRHILSKKENIRFHVLKNNKETEKSLLSIRVGDDVVLYPEDVIQFVGKVKDGIIFVDESSINGTTALVKKGPGSSIVKGMVVVEGSAVIEVTETAKRFARKINIRSSLLERRIKILNSILALLILIVVLLSFIYDKVNNVNSINNTIRASIAAIPCLFNIIYTIYNFARFKTSDPDAKLFDQTMLSEINDVDVVCLDKTGTITTGEYEIFKTIVLSQASFSMMSIDVNRAFDQTISNIIKTTKETGGYFSVLQDRYEYDVSKIIDQSSTLSDNGLYSAITIRGGKTYALGEAENFELVNADAVNSAINEYTALGYRVLLLVESKYPLKLGLIDGKSLAIGMIVLEEKIKNNAKDFIKYCLDNNKKVKVISGDRLSIVSELCRKAGLDNTNRAVSLRSIPFEQLDLLIDEYVVFADASPSQKAYIVQRLEKKKEKVLYIGDGDNDCPALKTASVGIALSTGSNNSKRCAQAVVRGDYTSFDEIKNKASNYKGKMNHLFSIMYAFNVFVIAYMFVFIIARYINPAINNPFEYQHLLISIIFGNILPAIVIIFEPEKLQYKQKSFLKNFIADSLMLIVPVALIYIGQLLQLNGVGYFGIPSDMNELHETLITSQVAYNISYLAFLLSTLFVTYSHLAPFNIYKTIGYIFVGIIPVAYVVLLIFNVDGLSTITQIETSSLTLANYFAGALCVVSSAAVYLLVLNIIEIVKGETDYVKNKSRS